MPRTVNEAVYRVRREAFLDAGQRLITTKGYEEMSIQDVLDELDTSRGAFYHYFDSKQALLEAVVERFADAAMERIQPILEDPDLPALRKLERVLGETASYKAGQRELVVALVQVWMADSNALVREKVRRLSAEKLGPILSRVISDGVRQGTVRVSHPDQTAVVVTELMLGFQGLAAGWFLERRAGTVPLEEVLRTYRAMTEAIERILGIEAGSVAWMDEATMKFWFA